MIFNPDDKILLCKSAKWNDQYVIPGGHIERGERMEDALRREIREETGLELYDIQLISLQESIDSDTFEESRHFIYIDFVCRTLQYEVTLDDEADAYCWVSLEEIEHLDLGGYTRQFFAELRKGEQSTHRRSILYNYSKQ